ncbi:MAG TPA: flagellar export chaperone FlgN [Pirellulales bacterium]
MDQTWDDELASLLNNLSAAQTELLEVLTRKRELLVAADLPGLEALEPRERDLAQRLQACHQQRADLLKRAAAAGLPGDSIRSLSGRLPAASRQAINMRVDEAASRMRLLRHQGITNWVLVQRKLLHLSQLLEIIATKGRLRPTYGRGGATGSASGAFVDQAA